MFITSGSLRGWIKRYLINPDSIDGGAFELLDEQMGNIREGVATRIFFDEINNDNYLEAIVGNDRGGLTIFKSSIRTDSLVNNEELFTTIKKPYEIFPNPTSGIFYLNVFEKINISVYDLLGQEIYSKKNILSNKKIDLSIFNSGTYFIKIEKDKRIYSEKLIIIKS